MSRKKYILHLYKYIVYISHIDSLNKENHDKTIQLRCELFFIILYFKHNREKDRRDFVLLFYFYISVHTRVLIYIDVKKRRNVIFSIYINALYTHTICTLIR